MLPYTTEANVIKIVNEKLKESGSQPIDKDTIVSIVNESIESGDISVSSFDEIELKVYISDFDITDPNIPILSNQEKINILLPILQKATQCKAIFGYIKCPRLERESELSLYGVAMGANNFGDGSDLDATSGVVFGNSSFRIGFLYVDTYIIPSIVNSMSNTYSQELLTFMANNPEEYILLKFRVEK